MEIGIIGYKNHSQRIINILKRTNKVKKIYVFNHNLNKDYEHKINSKVKITGNLFLLLNCNAVFVASPVKSHFKYANFFLKKKMYVFCEKPPFSNKKEIKNIKKLKNKIMKLYFNFNYQYLDQFQFLSKEIKNKKNGKLISINFSSSHGLIFKKSNSWRFKKNNNNLENIFGNLGIHYIYFIKKNFKKVQFMDKSFQSNKIRNVFDTVNLNLKLNNEVFSNIFLSYATVNFKHIKVYFTNCIIEIKNNKILKYSPRDSFDKFGKFITPKPKKIKIDIKNDINNSLEKSVRFFLKKISKKEIFSRKEIDLALEVNELLLKF